MQQTKSINNVARDAGHTIQFNCTKQETMLVTRIAKRAMAMTDEPVDYLSLVMDLEAAHSNGNPIQFEKLLKADDFNFAHDVFGIMRHINRATGKLMNCFSPRCSQQEAR
jgi:hypothetical protein